LRKFLTFKNCWRVLLLCVAVFLLIVGWTAFNIYSQSLITNDAPTADAAIVLGASIYSDVPSPVFRERINHALALFRNGDVKYIIFTGGFGRGEKLSEAAVAKNYAITQNIPAERIFIEEQSGTTFQNLYFAKEIVDKHHFQTVLLVSDPLHMKRIMVMAADLKVENAHPSPTSTSKIVSFSNKLDFLWQETWQLLSYQVRKMVLSDSEMHEMTVKRS
jgi:uncharacterized SAM-binding protein YcdF (DUF218 family)